MYSLFDYGRMVGDRVRMDAYARAIAQLVRPGDVVVDLGAGTGVCALLAAKAGARHVYAIETNPLVQLGAELASVNGVGDKITWLQQDARLVELPELADVLLADLRGVLPLYQGNFAIVADAVTRFLKPSARLAPLRDHLYCAPVSTARVARELWGAYVDAPCGLDWSPILRQLRAGVKNDRDARLNANDLLAQGQRWATLEYGVLAPAQLKGAFKFVADKAGAFDALAMWFDAELTAEVGFSNAPGSDLLYSRALLPLPRAVAIEAGQVIDAHVWVHETRDETAWSWHVRAANFEHRASFLDGALRREVQGPSAPLKHV
jgi:type I protein arginine methyltransferase